jgi:secreted trypsin-like serine protease
LANSIKNYIAIIAILFILISVPIISETAYAEKKIPNEKISKDKVPHLSPKAKIIEHGGLVAIAIPLYTTADDPANHIVGAGGDLDGVGDLTLNRIDGTFGCSGSLLITGMHVLTAAHCVTDNFGNFNLLSASITFEGDYSIETIGVDVANSSVHPKFDGDFIKGNDLAILKLVSTASSDITRYDIDRNSNDDVGSIAQKVGYGAFGTGNTGWTDFDDNKRQGLNLYDDVADTMLKALGLKPGKDFVRGSVLQYDFDNGLAENDAFGFFFGKSNLGLVNDEVASAPGDSGGPSYTSGVITGVTSYGITLQFVGGATSDITPGIDSSFGEFAGDTRVSKYADYIDGVLGGGIGGDPPGAKCPPGKEKKNLC